MTYGNNIIFDASWTLDTPFYLCTLDVTAALEPDFIVSLVKPFDISSILVLVIKICLMCRPKLKQAMLHHYPFIMVNV